MRSIWITWEKQRRNVSMAAATGATIHELEYRGNWLARYLVLGLRTLRLATRRDLEIVYFQNPSIVLAVLIAAMKFMRLIRCKTVGDFHNAGVFPPIARALVPWIVRHTDLVIVSNDSLAATITSFGGRALAIPDPLPSIAPAGAGSGRDRPPFEVFFICSWADDEPITEVLKAAQLLERSSHAVRISITGRPKLASIGWREPLPANVALTGFLDKHDFERRLANSALVLDLTTRADCMVCGAYEATAAEVPAILSDNEPTRRYFSKGMLYTDNTAESIARCILEGKMRHASLVSDVLQLKGELRMRDIATIRALRDEVTCEPPPK